MLKKWQMTTLNGIDGWSDFLAVPTNDPDSDRKKSMLLEMARRGDPKPRPGEHPLGNSLANYLNKQHGSYDPDFEKDIREAVPFWFATDKEKSLNEAHGVFRRAKERGSLPLKSSKDPQEIKDALWLGSKRNAFLGNCKVPWYSEYADIATFYGFPNTFTSRKDRAIKRANEVFQRAEKRGYLPRCGSLDPQEYSDYLWVQKQRQAKLGRKGTKWYPIIDKIAKRHDFRILNRREQFLVEVHSVLQRAEKRGNLPACRSQDHQERKDAGLMSRLRRYKLGKIGTWHPELDKIIAESRFTDCVKVVDRKQETIQRAKSVFQKAREFGRLPLCLRGNKKTQEGKDARWLVQMRQARLGRKGQGQWVDTLLQISIDFGFPNAFDIGRGECLNGKINCGQPDCFKRNALPLVRPASAAFYLP